MPMVAAMASVVIITTISIRVKPAVRADPRSGLERFICYPRTSLLTTKAIKRQSSELDLGVNRVNSKMHASLYAT